MRGMSTTTAEPTLGDLFRDERKRRGWSLGEAEIQARQHFPKWAVPKASRIQRIETGSSAPATPIEVAVLAAIYDINQDRLDEETLEALRVARDLLVSRIMYLMQNVA
jgi:hypothetical protein